MEIGLIFWVIMLLWLIFGFMWNSNSTMFGTWGLWGNWLLLFILFVLLGWKVFGPAIHG